MKVNNVVGKRSYSWKSILIKMMMDILKEKILHKMNGASPIQNIQVLSGILILVSLFMDFLLTGKIINQYIYLFIFISISIISARLTDRLFHNLSRIKLSALRNEIRHFGLPIQLWENILKKPSFLKVEYEERAVIESWVREITDRYIINWYGTCPTEESSKFVLEVQEELRFAFKGFLSNLQTRNWKYFLIKLSNLIILHLKRKSFKVSEPVYRHPILMKTISEHDYYVSALSALLNKFGNRTKYAKYANSNFCSLHHLIIIEILAHQLVTSISNLSSNGNTRKKSIQLSTNVNKVENVEEEPLIQSATITSKESKANILEETHIKIIEGSSKKRPSISLPNILNKSINLDENKSMESISESTKSMDDTDSNLGASSTRDSAELEEELSFEIEEVRDDEGEAEEDMESAICKLRKLLEEKESIYDQTKSKSLKIPSDGRIFFNIQMTNDGADMYSITYDAVIINKTSSMVPSSNQFEYTTKTIQSVRSYDEFMQLDKDLKKKFNLEFTLENGGSISGHKYDIEVLKAWLDSLIHHYEASTSSEVKQFLKYPIEEIDLQLGKVEKGQRIDKFLAKTVSGVFNSIKDRLPNFEEDNAAQDEDAEHLDHIVSEESGLYTDLKDRLDHTISDKEFQAMEQHLPVKLNFFPMANELSELEINLNCAIHEEVRLRKEQAKQNNMNDTLIFQRGDNYKKFIEKEMFKDELTEGLSEKVIQMAALAFVDEMNGKYSWVKSQFIMNLANLLLSQTVDEIIEDVLASWTNENAWKAIFMQLRQILWYEEIRNSSTWLEEQAPFVRNILRNAFSSKEANRELVYNVTDLILSTVLRDDDK